MFLIFDVSFLIEVENKFIALEHMPSKFICLPVAEIRRVFFVYHCYSLVIVSRAAAVLWPSSLEGSRLKVTEKMEMSHSLRIA